MNIIIYCVHMDMIVSDLRIDVELDCKGMFCPMPVVQLKKATKNMQLGQVLRLVATDPDSKIDTSSLRR